MQLFELKKKRQGVTLDIEDVLKTAGKDNRALLLP